MKPEKEGKIHSQSKQTIKAIVGRVGLYLNDASSCLHIGSL